MDIKIWITLLVLSVISGLAIVIVGDSKKKRKTFGVITGILLVSAVIVGFAYTNLVFNTSTATFSQLAVTGATPSGVVPSGEIIIGCTVEDTTVTLSATDFYTESPSGGNHRYSLNGNPALTVSNAGTLTASPGDTLSLLFFNASNNGSYYSEIKNVQVPCKGTATFSTKLYQNGSLTIQVYNEEGNVINSANNETLASGDVPSLKLEIKGQYQRGLPYGGLIVCDYNRTDIDDCIIGTVADKVDVPASYVTASGRNSKAYRITPIVSNGKFESLMVIDVDDTNNPSPLDVGALNLTVFPYNYFIDENNGGAYAGPSAEDELDAQTYLYKPTLDVFVA